MSIGILIAMYPIKPELSALGSFLLIFMAFTTLSFLITTPEAWVPALGDANHGFPFLSGMGRLVIKDAIMLGAAFLTLTDAARESLRRRKFSGLTCAPREFHPSLASPNQNSIPLDRSYLAQVAVGLLLPTSQRDARETTFRWSARWSVRLQRRQSESRRYLPAETARLPSRKFR